jgi:ribosomal protein L6P/L9E
MSNKVKETQAQLIYFGRLTINQNIKWLIQHTKKGKINKIKILFKGHNGYLLSTVETFFLEGWLRGLEVHEYPQNRLLLLFEKKFLMRFKNKLKEFFRGVMKGWRRDFKIVGLAAKIMIYKKRKIIMELGHTHWDLLDIPQGIKVRIRKRMFSIRSVSKVLLNEFIKSLLSVKGPTPYKIRGIVDVKKSYKLKIGKKK